MKKKRIAGLLSAAAALSAGYCAVSSQQFPESGMLRVSAAAAPAAGDLNGDGELTVSDAVLLARLIAEDRSLSRDAFTEDSADFDADGSLTVQDVQKLLDKLAEQKPVPVLTDADSTLTILCWDGWEQEFQLMADIFKANHPSCTSQIQFKQIGSSGMEARDQYAMYFDTGEDADLYLTEADWILDYINRDDMAMPMSELGFRDSDFQNCFPYTRTVGRDSSGTLKAVSWQATPGVYAYRADLAKSLLGVQTPAEMQAKVKDWDTFTATAETVRSRTNGKTAMADSMGGLWQAWRFGMPRSYVYEDGIASVTESGNNFANLARLYKEKGYVSSADQWTTEWAEIGQNDETMGYFFCNWCFTPEGVLASSEGGKGGASYGKYNVTQGPVQWFWGGGWLAASPLCNTRKTAHDFLYDIVVNPDSTLQYMNENGEFVNNAEAVAQFNASSGYSNPLLGGQSQYPTLLDNAQTYDLPYTPSPYDEVLSYPFYSLIQEYANGQITTVSGLQSRFRREIEDLLNG